MPSKKSNRNKKRSSKRPNLVAKRIQALDLQTARNSLPNTLDASWPINLKQNKPHTFVLSAEYGNINSTASSPSAGAITISLNLFDIATSLQGCFDSYRINLVKVCFNPYNISTQPPLATCIDYDDNSAPGTFGSVADRDTGLIVPSNTYFQRVFQPRFATPLYSGSVFNNFSQAQNPWVDMVNIATPCYGLKYYMAAPTVTATFYEVSVTAMVQVKNNF